MPKNFILLPIIGNENYEKSENCESVKNIKNLVSVSEKDE